MNCRECGKEISSTSNFCTYCGASVKKENISEKNISMQKADNNNDENKAIPLCIGSLVLIFGILGGIGIITGIVLMIVARIKYPKSIFAKVLMWLYIIVLLIAVIVFVYCIISRYTFAIYFHILTSSS